MANRDARAEQEVHMIVDEDGNVKIEVFGCTGAECSALTADLEEALGVVVHDEKKPEYRAVAGERDVARSRR